MKSPHTLITIAAITLTACNYLAPDPCAGPAGTNPLAPNGSETLAHCQECPEEKGKPCPPSGETGDEEDEPGPVLSCSPDDHTVCFNGDLTGIDLGIPGGLETVDSNTCPNLSTSFDCSKRWGDQNSAWAVDRYCVYCDIDDPQDDDAELIGVAHDFGEAWPVCTAGDGTAYLAKTSLHGSAPWYDRMFCPDFTVGGGCEPHHMRYDGDPATYLPTASSITCGCPEHNDSECQNVEGFQEVAVCHAWFVANDHHGHHGYTQPTLCTWDGGHGSSTPNMSPPSPGMEWGPDFVAVSGDKVSIAPDVFLWLTRGEFDRFGATMVTDDAGDYLGLELAWADADSLPTYLGIDVGDLVLVTQATSDTLATGAHDLVEVRAPSGAVRWLDVVVEAR